MGATWDEITTSMTLRRSEESLIISRMIDIRDRYNNDIVIPMVDVDTEPMMRMLMPQVIHDGIEGIATRAAGMMPNLAVPSLKKTDGSRVKANRRRRALLSAWDNNSLDMLNRRAFRQLAGYGSFAMSIMPDFTTGRASIELRDPLTAYPDLRAPEQMNPPVNVGFLYGRSAPWIIQKYGDSPGVRDFLSAGQRGRSRYSTRAPETLWDLVEWIDEDVVVIGILGPRRIDDLTTNELRTISAGMELKRWPNRAGMVTVAVPRRVTLDRIGGQMDQIVGHVDWMAKLMALEVLAAERDVFPDVAVIGDQNAIPSLDDGVWKDGRTGQVNLVSGAKAIQMLHAPPGSQTQAVLQGLERSARMSSGATPLYGGDNPNSLRTGRAIDSIGGFSVDPMVAEVQQILARALAKTVNPSILCVEKGYWPDKKYVCFSGERADNALVEYQPSIDFEETATSVSYSFPGTDISQITVAIAQLVGADMISKHTGRELHPLIDNGKQEEEYLVGEQIDAALLNSMLQQASAGQLPPNDLARVRQLVNDGSSLTDAVLKAHEEAQQRQATAAPPAQPGQVGPPQAQPGLAQPGMGAEQPMETQIQPPAPALDNFRQLTRSLRSG